jgi:hypothetical protein
MGNKNISCCGRSSNIKTMLADADKQILETRETILKIYIRLNNERYFSFPIKYNHFNKLSMR